MNINVAVLLYGVYDPQLRTAPEMEGYGIYLAKVARYIAELDQEFDVSLIVLCGGKTNGEISEAASVKPALIEQLRLRGFAHSRSIISLEETSFNTPQNLWGAQLIITSYEAEKRPTFIICDEVRAFKTRILAWLLLRRSIRTRTIVGLPRPDIHPRSKWLIQTLAGLGYLLKPGQLKADLAAEAPR